MRIAIVGSVLLVRDRTRLVCLCLLRFRLLERRGSLFAARLAERRRILRQGIAAQFEPDTYLAGELNTAVYSSMRSAVHSSRMLLAVLSSVLDWRSCKIARLLPIWAQRM
jgi:hypothetical protein